MRAERRRARRPLRAEHAREMRMRKERDAPRVRGEQLVDERLRAPADIGEIFAFGNRRRPYRPVRPFLANILRFTAFVDAVIPLVQFRLDLRMFGETREAAGFDRAV